MRLPLKGVKILTDGVVFHLININYYRVIDYKIQDMDDEIEEFVYQKFKCIKNFVLKEPL